MPVANLRTNTLEALKPMADNSVNTYIRQAVGNESLLSFSRTGDTPVQWFQLLNALDQQDLQGWPFMAPVKIQMQKCDKCSKEFCSPINHRRHIRVHRRSLRTDKEWHKNRRDLLAAFWDKLSSETTKEIMSFDDVTLEEVSGSSIIWSLTSFVRKPGYSVFPLQYINAGSALLDIIQSRPSRLPISSQELFAILDEASEGTFLCAGTAESMQRFVFDGEAGKIGMDPKNLVACTSFLIEQKLVRYWVADMDAESLRCQQLLVEEEEAAQKRQAKILERKRLKKLRQKEHKAEEQGNGEVAELEDNVFTLDRPSSSETTNPSVSSESSSNFIDATVDHPFSFSLSLDSNFIQEHTDVEPQSGLASETSDTGPYPNIENQSAFGNERKQSNASRWQVHKPQRTRNGFHSGLDLQISKVEPVQRNGPPRDQRPTQAVNGHKIWTRKPKPGHDDGERFNTKMEKAAPNCERKPVHYNVEKLDTRGKKAAPNCKPKPFPDSGEKVETTPIPKLEHDNGESVSSTQVEKTAPTLSHQTDQNCEVIFVSKPNPVPDNGVSSDAQVEEAETTPKPKHNNRESVGSQVEKADPTQSHQTDQNSKVMIGSKPKPEHDNGESISTQVEKAAPTQSLQSDQNCEVMIGSISVTLGKYNSLQQNELPVSDDSCQEKHTETSGDVSRSKLKLWRPVSRHGNRGRSGSGEFTEDIVRESNEKAVLNESRQRACDSDGNDLQEGTIQPEGFSTEAAKAFLSQRWKEATSGEHVSLVLTSETELFDSQEAENNYHVTKTPSDSQTRIILGNADNLQENIVVFEPSTNRAVKEKSKTNPEKGVKTKYIPKKKTATKGK